MYDRDDRPLGSLAEDAYETLLDTIAPSEGISAEEAHDRLCDDGFTAEDADYVLTKLLNRGYLYEVEDTLFITEREDNSK